MCTVVCCWQPRAAAGIEMLALRDELASRPFDTPDRWWPGQPSVVGGRDRAAGGSWCVSDVDTATTAVVLNRPERPLAEPGGSSRGALVLLAVRHFASWPRFIDFRSMASFNLVLATPTELRWWSWDGDSLLDRQLQEGTYLFTPTAVRAEPSEFRAANDTVGSKWGAWRTVIEGSDPSTDPSALIVEKPVGADSYETVFGQHLVSRPGMLRLDHAIRPRRGASWITEVWESTS